MDIGFILKIAGVGLLVNVLCQILSKTGKEEQSMMVSVSGIIIVLIMLIFKIGELISLIENIFGLG